MMSWSGRVKIILLRLRFNVDCSNSRPVSVRELQIGVTISTWWMVSNNLFENRVRAVQAVQAVHAIGAAGAAGVEAGGAGGGVRSVGTRELPWRVDRGRGSSDSD